MDQDKLKVENANLVTAFREKSRKHQQTQELYDRLKRKEMTAVTQSAAFESVDEVLQSASNHTARHGLDNVRHDFNLQTAPRGSVLRQYPQLPLEQRGLDQALRHRRDGSDGSGGSGRMMPPPIQRPTNVYGNHELGGSRTGGAYMDNCDRSRLILI